MIAQSAQLALMIDLERCTGCKSCEAACKQTNALGPHTYRNRVMWFDEQQSAVDTGMPKLDFLTVTCQQCERPACLRACPVFPKAIEKDPVTGVVSINENRCTGCGECALSCPYGAIGYSTEKHHAVKCDLCAERRARDKGPACASVCPTRAISFGKREDLLKQAEADNRETVDTDYFLQNPATIYLQRLRDMGIQNKKPVEKTTPALMSDHDARRNLIAEVATGSYKKSEKIDQVKQPERIVPGGCHICFNGCPVKFHLRGNKVVNVYGNEDDPIFQGRVCAKSQMTLQLYNNPHRLTQPLKRVGKRGSGNFKPISWDQALDEIAEKLRKVKQRYGSEALAIQAGSRTGTLTINGIIPLFAGLWGTANVASTEPYCSMSKSVALNLTQGSGLMASVYTGEDIGSAGAYVYIGDNQAETRPVNFGMVNDWRIKNKTRMIVVDPRLTVTASKADEWLPIRSGTDMALGLGIIHYLFEQNLFDKVFCERWLIGWQAWRDFVIDKQYNLEWTAKVTDLPINQIKDLATTIAKANGCMIFLSRGINQHTNATQTNRVFMFVAAMTGNWGRRGGGYFNVSSELGWKKPHIPEQRKASIKQAVCKNPSEWLDAMLDGEPYPIRALIASSNPLAQWPDLNRVIKAVKTLDLVVHLELFKSATSQFADYILPMATGIEKGGTSRFAEDRRIVWNDRFIDPPGEAKSDHWFWIELGKRFDFDDVLKENYKNPRILWDEVLVPCATILSTATTKQLTDIPTRNLRLPAIRAGESDPCYITENHANNSGEVTVYPTASGKLEFWTESMEQKFNRVGLSALPEFYSEAEQLIELPRIKFHEQRSDSPFLVGKPFARGGKIVQADHDEKPEFDTELITGRPPAPHFHSWTHYFWQAQEMWPELYCQIHPSKAKEISIDDGDNLLVQTANGGIRARAWIHRGIRPDSIFIPIGWDQQQPYHPASSVNHLTGVKLDPVSQQANLKTHLCRVSKFV